MDVPAFSKIPCFCSATITPFSYSTADNAVFGAVYDASGDLVRESQRHSRRKLIPRDPARLTDDVEIVHVSSAVYCGHLIGHFGHFITETLPQSYWGTLDVDYVIFHPWTGTGRRHHSRVPYIRPVFDALGIDESRVLIGNQRILVDKLYVPDRRNFVVDGYINDPEKLHVYDILREHFQTNQLHKRVFFSRRKWHRNRNNVDNQIEVDALFADYGFTIVIPEELTIGQQIDIAGTANIVAGEIGSALHLSAFMKPESLVVALGDLFPNLIKFSEARGIRTALLDVLRDGEIDIVALRNWLACHLPSTAQG